MIRFRKCYSKLKTILLILCIQFIFVKWVLFQLIPIDKQIFIDINVTKTYREIDWLVNTTVKYYRISANASYHYEFRYQLSTNIACRPQRLILLLNGHKRRCVDWWLFSVGRRVLNAMLAQNYMILSVCSIKSTFDYNIPVEENQDVIWLYKYIQIWMNEVYYTKYQQYPLLYLYGLSRGSHFAALLSRVLPIQAQILYIYPGYFEAMNTPSIFDKDLQTRFIVDPEFASWFHFKYCFTTASNLCVFQTDRRSSFNPVPPTLFVHVSNDALLYASNYTRVISAVKNNSYALGGLILQEPESFKIHISTPVTPTPTYMQEYFYPWRQKPRFSQLFYQHLVGFLEFPEQNSSKYEARTFWCHRGDFTFFEKYPSVLRTWSEQQQQEYHDYTDDIRTFHTWLTEELCGDLMGNHAMLSLDIDRALSWAIDIDSIRRHLQLQDFLSRRLRVWMYDKKMLIPPLFAAHHLKANCSQAKYANRMYLSENIVQKYFKTSTYVDNPLLADYFVVPHDLYCLIFCNQLISNFTNEQYRSHVSYYSEHYFEPLINNLQSSFPFWTMKNQHGANHVIAFVGGRNMGVLNKELQIMLRNVIQLGPTGVRQDLLTPNGPELYLHRNLSIVYRHGYDIVIPPYTPTQSTTRKTRANRWYQRKKQLFYFAGILNHSVSVRSLRRELHTLAQMAPVLTKIEDKEFHTVHVIDGHVSIHNYLNSIVSSVFLFCPEGYSPWSPRIYEAINLGSIPLILADGLLLPFERFIPWRSFSLKLNVSNVHDFLNFVIGNNASNFQERVERKRNNGQRFKQAFHWSFKNGGKRQLQKSAFLRGDNVTNVFQYIYKELKCRWLEQLFGASSDTLSYAFRSAQQKVCETYSKICPCETDRPIAFDEYSYGFHDIY